VSRILGKRHIRDGLVGVAILISMAALLFYPSVAISAAKDGLSLCGNVIIPSLFPFFVLSSLVVEFGLASYIGHALERIMRPLFNVGGVCSVAFSLGIIGGYPVGARTAISLYEKGLCSKTEAERLLSFCNNSGPAFILGVVGAGIFSSSRVGLILYLAHILASVFVGILFRFYGREGGSRTAFIPRQTASVRFYTAFAESVRGALASTLAICAFVVFFTVFIKLLFASGAMAAAARFITFFMRPFGMNEAWAERLLTGIIEISSGVASLRGVEAAITSRMAMAAFMLGWAGLSVHCQVLSFIGQSNLRVHTYIGGKALHGLISAALIFLFSRLWGENITVASYLAEQINGISSMGFRSALTISAAVSWFVWVIFVLIATRAIRKSSGKRRRGEL
jgi:sporulation integral membrane protein YlbJ